MPHLSVPFSSGACLLDIWVGVSEQREAAIKAAGQPVPPPIRLRAMIDTGASGTAIDEDAIVPLGLSPTGKIQIHTPSTGPAPILANQYDVLLGIYHPTFSLVLGTVPVIHSDLKAMGIAALLGRDVLSKCLLIVDGQSGSFTLAF